MPAYLYVLIFEAEDDSEAEHYINKVDFDAIDEGYDKGIKTKSNGPAKIDMSFDDAEVKQIILSVPNGGS